MNNSEILRLFGVTLKEDSLQSLYNYAPVYRFNHGDRDYVLKRTGVRSTGNTIAAWTNDLVSQGIKSVAPVGDFDRNPRQILNEENDTEENWVIYPFIKGIPYTGNKIQILAAGKLLGEIHAAGMEKDFDLKVNQTVVAIEADKIEREIKETLQKVEQYAPEKLQTTRDTLNFYSQHYLKNVLHQALHADLPLTNCSCDYKAANIVYQTNSAPVLIDPDHGGRIPRMYDLATSLLLFHCDLAPAPKRIFTLSEWSVFLAGYKQHLKPTVEERETWKDVLLCAWIDQALWLLSHFPEGWADKNESLYLQSLLNIDLSSFFI